MKTSLLRFVLPLAALAFVAPGSVLAQKGKGGGDSGSGSAAGPVVIPGGTYAEAYLINLPGSYVLGGNRTMTQTANHIIEIKAPDVTLDLRGHTLSFTGGNATGNGVHIESTENVSVRDGTIANASIGVSASSGSTLKLSDLRILGGNSGIVSKAYNVSISGCQIADVAGTAISATVGGALIKDCTINLAGETGIHAVSSLIQNVNVNECKVGASIADSMLTDSRVYGCTEVGITAHMNTTLRNNFILGCKQTAVMVGGIRVTLVDNVIVDTKMMNGIWRGIYSPSHSFLAIGNRMKGNGNNVVGPMVDGGGNTIW